MGMERWRWPSPTSPRHFIIAVTRQPLAITPGDDGVFDSPSNYVKSQSSNMRSSSFPNSFLPRSRFPPARLILLAKDFRHRFRTAGLSFSAYTTNRAQYVLIS